MYFRFALLTIAFALFPIFGLTQSAEKDEEMTAAKIVALWKKADDRSKMVPEIKSIFPSATALKIEVTFQDKQGKRTLPGGTADEKWVDGKWVLSRIEAKEFPGEDKEMIFATTYDSTTKTYIQFLKPMALTREEAPAIKSTGKRIGESRTVKWATEKDPQGGESITTTTYSDTDVTWLEIHTKDGDELWRVMGTATKVR